MKKSAIITFAVLVVVLTCWSAFELLTRQIHATLSYCLEATFEKLPGDDLILERWLRGQPGIIPHTVIVDRFEDGERIKLKISFFQSRSLAGIPFIPDIDNKCSELGYEARGGFNDCKSQILR